MELNRKTLSFSFTLTAGILYLICAAFVWLLPELTFKLLGWITHIRGLEAVIQNRVVDFGGLVGGLAIVMAYAYIGAWLFAGIYNKLLLDQNKGSSGQAPRY